MDNKIYSISEISNLLKVVVENNFADICVKAELSGIVFHASGHIYFSLKDKNSVLDAICWRGNAKNLSIKPQEGLEVICKGRLTTYSGRSKYQIIISSMELAGEGELLKLLEKLKRKLALEGIFDQSNKKLLPFIPDNIGVVTSGTGAVIRDILHRLNDRLPTNILLWPVSVQGVNASREVSEAIKGFNDINSDCKIKKPDLLIIARGGGSLEDLWAFNEEIIVRAVANSEIPIISAIGHETDTTLIDYAADYRAPTPTAAAEKAVPVKIELLNKLNTYATRVQNTFRYTIEEFIQKRDNLYRKLQREIQIYFQKQESILERYIIKSPEGLAEQKQELLNNINARMLLAIKNYMSFINRKLIADNNLLRSFSYEKILQRGFCLVRDKSGVIIKQGKQMQNMQEFMINFSDSTILAEVRKIVKKQ